MELRSRSRSSTPLLTQIHERDVGNHITRTTRRSVKSVTESITMEEKSKKSSKSQKNRYITSDYSSEEGETTINSSGLDNIKNQMREDFAHSANGEGRVSALKLYKEAGDYWNKFPKTDYTYSKHSRDRVELAPGVVAMPNMSRRSLHGSEGIVSHKQTNTETSATEESFYSSFARRLKPRAFTNNNEDDGGFVIRKRSIHEVTFFQRIVVYALTVCHVALYPLFYLYDRQQSLFLWFGKTFHRIASRVMLWDTWSLQKNVSGEKKLYGIVSLCLLPLLLFGGLWILYGIASGLNTWMSSTPLIFDSPVDVVGVPKVVDDINPKGDLDFDDIGFQKRMVRFIEGMGFFKKATETGVSPDDISKRLTTEQLGFIAENIKKDVLIQNSMDVDYIVQKLLENPQVQKSILLNNDHDNNNNILTDINEELQRIKQKTVLIETLQNEIVKIRGELDQREKSWKSEIFNVLTRLRSQSEQENAKLTLEVKRCCRQSLIQVEHYVSKILRDLLTAPNYATGQDDIPNWLHTVFVAKEDLEGKIANLTHHLKSDFDQVIKNNAKVIMTDVSTKISTEISKNLQISSRTESNLNDIKVNAIDDERVRAIVSESLAVYDADKTGLVDYAMESAGGQIVSTRCTESYQVKTAVVSILGIPVWYPSNTPRTVITPGVKPGECWAFQNFPGFLLVKLSGLVKITSFSMEHLSRKLAPHGRVDSAPRDFEVYGLRAENDLAPVLLGTYKYLSDGEPLQFFPVQGSLENFELVELRILSNHGNPNYTCLYRFRVHGELQNGPT